MARRKTTVRKPRKRVKTRVVKRAKRMTGKSNRKADSKRSALAPGKRIPASGKPYYERRRNRSDINGRAKKGKRL